MNFTFTSGIRECLQTTFSRSVILSAAKNPGRYCCGVTGAPKRIFHFAHRHTPRWKTCAPTHAGFTLIELLMVIAIIGILAAIVIPGTSSARLAASKARTRVQFAQWATAIEGFRQEYGYYPQFEANNKVNGTTVAAASGEGPHLFHDLLAGTRRDGSALPAVVAGAASNPPRAEAQNSRRIQFLSFSDGDLVPFNAADSALLSKRGLIRTAFDGTDIVVLVDRNLDGFIRTGGTDFAGTLPTVTAPDTGESVPGPSAEDFPAGASGGIRAGVIFYCALPKATSNADLLMSWK